MLYRRRLYQLEFDPVAVRVLVKPTYPDIANTLTFHTPQY